MYNWLAPKVLGLCVRYMQDRDEAEDVMQDAFVKIFTSLDSYKGSGSFEGWAKRIAVNTALTSLKKKKRMFFERNLDLAGNLESQEEDEQPIGIDAVLKCLHQLPVGYRTIINMYLVEEFSHAEIAGKLGITESTSRSQFARARQSLIRLLKEENKIINTVGHD